MRASQSKEICSLIRRQQHDITTVHANTMSADYLSKRDAKWQIIESRKGSTATDNIRVRRKPRFGEALNAKDDDAEREGVLGAAANVTRVEELSEIPSLPCPSLHAGCLLFMHGLTLNQACF